MGLEPICDLLLFLLLIRKRRYFPMKLWTSFGWALGLERAGTRPAPTAARPLEGWRPIFEKRQGNRRKDCFTVLSPTELRDRMWTMLIAAFLLWPRLDSNQRLPAEMRSKSYLRHLSVFLFQEFKDRFCLVSGCKGIYVLRSLFS